MVKYSGYSKASDSHLPVTGAFLGQSYKLNLPECYNSSEWKKLTFEFYSGDNTTYSLALLNGLSNSCCKGTAWFSNFRLEERVGKPTNRWNVLAVVFKNVKAYAELDGKRFLHEGTLNDDDVKHMEKVMNGLCTSVPLLSEGIWRFNSIDVVSTDTVVNKLNTYDENKIDVDSERVSKVLDKYINKAEMESGKKYDQIIIISPLWGATGSWIGKGGSTYKGINICQGVMTSGDDWFKNGNTFPESLFVHEMLHCAERISRDELNSPTQALHACYDTYSKDYHYGLQEGWKEYGKYYSDYIRCKTPDNKGVDKRAFNTYRNCTYKVVYGSEPTYPKTDVSKLTISKPKDKIYTGKAIKQKLTVKDGKKTLIEGKDYTLSYLKNTEVGYAAVIVNGKGKYSGKCAQNFKILPKKNKLTVSKSGNEYSFSWQKSTEANGYEIYVSKNGGKSYSLLETVYGDESAVSVTINSSANLKFKMRSFKQIYPQKFYSNYSAVVTAKIVTGNEESFESGKQYSIRCKKVDKSLIIYNSGISEGDNLILFTYLEYKSQKWYLEKLSNGYYVIRNRYSNLVLGVESNSTKDGANIAQYIYNGSQSQQWKIENINGYYKIINCKSGKALEVEGANCYNGANISQNEYCGKDHQLWIIEAVE